MKWIEVDEDRFKQFIKENELNCKGNGSMGISCFDNNEVEVARSYHGFMNGDFFIYSDENAESQLNTLNIVTSILNKSKL